MADSWTVTAVDRDLVSVNVVVGPNTYPYAVSVAELGPIANLTDAAAKIRPLVTAFYNSIVTKQSVPAKFQGAVGYTEAFS